MSTWLPQVPVTHAPFVQSSAVVQLVPHWVPVASQVYGAHEKVIAATQPPLPLQIRAMVSFPSAQEVPEQLVPAGYNPQWPEPSQAPS